MGRCKYTHTFWLVATRSLVQYTRWVIQKFRFRHFNPKNYCIRCIKRMLLILNRGIGQDYRNETFLFYISMECLRLLFSCVFNDRSSSRWFRISSISTNIITSGSRLSNWSSFATNQGSQSLIIKYSCSGSRVTCFGKEINATMFNGLA